MKYTSYLPAYEDGTEGSETSAYKIQTPGNYPEASIQHSEHGGNFKSRISFIYSLSLLMSARRNIRTREIQCFPANDQ